MVGSVGFKSVGLMCNARVLLGKSGSGKWSGFCFNSGEGVL